MQGWLCMSVKDKIVYIGTDVKELKFGGDVFNYRNEKILKDLFDRYFTKFELAGSDNILFNLLKKIFLYPKELSPLAILRFTGYIKKNAPKWVFMSTSQYGRLVPIVKKFTKTRIITYFQNIEKKYAQDYLSIKKPHTVFFYWLCSFNEYRAVKYSDICICINERDGNMLKQIYNRNYDVIIPLSIDDTFDIDKGKMSNLHEKIHSKKALFVGSNFFGNTQGLLWFIKNVLPFVDVKLQIVGTGMSKEFKETEKMEVYDYVKDLSSFYFNADFIILPIISGSGMKTKTAEALMYGKAIIGTSEAFEGYNLSDTNKMFICQSDTDFIEAIKRIYHEDIFYFNEDVRDIFLKAYSTEKMKEKFLKVFDE
jgi:hypothetical protein